jgi:hypothetical protein
MSVVTRASLARLALAVAVAGAATVAFAQGKGFPMMEVDRDEYRGFTVSSPIANLNGESILHLEANLGGHAALALEGVFKRGYEEIDAKEAEETHESRSSTAKGGSLIFSRYTHPMSMSGLYWGIGVGYRQESVNWRVQPDSKDKAVNYSLVNEDMRLAHDATLSGTTGHARFGYRYVAVEWPFVVGGYLGARHFQAGVKDTDVDGKDQENVRLAPMTDREKERLRRKYATRPECGVEVGFRF